MQRCWHEILSTVFEQLLLLSMNSDDKNIQDHTVLVCRIHGV